MEQVFNWYLILSFSIAFLTVVVGSFAIWMVVSKRGVEFANKHPKIKDLLLK